MPERFRNGKDQNTNELVSFQPELVGLQTRMLLGGNALNPNKLDIIPLTIQNLGDLESRNYTIFDSASNKERAHYWNGKENNEFERQKNFWVNDLVSLFDENKEFFTKSKKGKNWSALYAKLGINTQAFTKQNAEELYAKYFTGDKKESNIKKFLKDIVGVYKKPDGQIDVQGLQQNLNGIQWLANIFGDISSEVVSQLIDAEIKLQTQPQKLIEAANFEQNGVLRINNLNLKEKEILTFLTGIQATDIPGRKTEPKKPGPTPPGRPTWPPPEKKNLGKKVGDVVIRYERPDDPKHPEKPRIFPEKFEAFRLIAQDLKRKYPKDFVMYSTSGLEKKVQRDLRDIQRELDQYGLTNQELHNMTIEAIDELVLDNYSSFIQKTYGITLPTTEKLQVIPIKGALAKYINPGEKALAFVNITAPYIYMDFDVIEIAARTKAHRHGWKDLDKTQLGNFIKSLLAEIQPHEYTHLLSDLAFFNFYQLDSNNRERFAKALPAKVGLQLVKMKDPKRINRGVQFKYSERGRGLMEAVTVELTKKWADAKNIGPLDIPAYAWERQILYELQNMLSREEGIHNQESFKQFVHGYFERDGFRRLTELIDGHTKDQNGHSITKRPHLLSMIYALMEYEAERQGGTGAAAYRLTYSFLQKSLSPEQKQEIIGNLYRINLPPKIREQLRNQIT